MSNSVHKHNVKKDIFADWLEGSIVFAVEELSQSDVVDVLCESYVYEDQDFAAEFVSDVWMELNRRWSTMNKRCLWKLDGRRLIRSAAWDSIPTYSFCLLVSLLPGYREWAKQFGKDYNEQGALFEKITAESLESIGWTVHITGWQRDNPSKIEEVVNEVCDAIGESPRPSELKKWVSESANEEGLDIVCWDPYPDGWGGRSLYFFQCASGENWPSKTHTPDPVTWNRIVSFSNHPVKAFSIPFALLKDDFTRSAGRVNGILLDRCRLHACNEVETEEWSSDTLRKDIIKWLKPRIKKLPTL